MTMTHTYWTAWAYHNDTGKTRRSQRRHPDPECARRAAERLIGLDPEDPWGWSDSARGYDAGNYKPGDEQGCREAGDWQLVIRRHRQARKAA